MQLTRSIFQLLRIFLITFLVLAGVVVLFYLSLFTIAELENGKKIRSIKKEIDHLNLNFPPEQLLEDLDYFEELVKLLNNRFNKEIILGSGFDGMFYINDSVIDYNKTNYSNYILDSLNSYSLTESEFLNVHRIIIDLAKNDISLYDFAVGYSCNDQTKIYYKERLCDNSNWCNRELVISKTRDASMLCYDRSEYLIVDSLKCIYLLKPKPWDRDKIKKKFKSIK